MDHHHHPKKIEHHEKSHTEQAPPPKPAMSISGAPSGGNNTDGFNIDDILHMDVIPGLSNILEDACDPLMDLHESKTNSNKIEATGSRSVYFEFYRH